MISSLAFRYANALADLAGTSRAEPVAADLDAFVLAVQTSADLRKAIQSPAVPPKSKRAVVTRLSQILPLSDLVKRFLFVVIDHRRSGMIADIRDAFRQVMDERTGVARADVASARDLSADERAHLAGSLRRLTGKQVRAEFRIEPELIGGAVARIGSTVYDGSIKGQLEALKERLAGAGR